MKTISGLLLPPSALAEGSRMGILQSELEPGDGLRLHLASARSVTGEYDRLLVPEYAGLPGGRGTEQALEGPEEDR